ncbi:zinc finger protein RFP-like [Elgaria multicarinata webbii]|uniref:zinc finger protein RFP-like n=1 Tax=Elgaria multicarinata webbii TaxID=159646 RepID=UPI002FCCD2E0
MGVEQEATCAMCLECLTAPVTLDCGHNYCLGCITKHCETREELEEGLECPVCRAQIQKGDFRPNWQLANIVEQIKLLEKESLCEKHKEKLRLFCKEDEELVCWKCKGSQDHKSHTVLPKEEAAEEYKKQTQAEWVKTVDKFRRLRQFLENQENRLLDHMEEVKKESNEHLSRLSKELSSLDSLIREMEEKCQQPASEFLQDVASTLERCEQIRMLGNPVGFLPALKLKIWEFCDITYFLEGVMKQFRDAMLSRYQLRKANLTLDPDTAHPWLILSEDRKSVRWGDKQQDLPDNLERFNCHPFVLGREGFIAGRHFWEVNVGSEEAWAVGVARKSVKRKNKFFLSPKEGVSAVGKWGGQYKAFNTPYYSQMPLSGELKRMRVTLNCQGGRVAFYDAETAALLHTFSAASFSGETLLPFFYVNHKAPLSIHV